jgi:hypothetical protein
MQCADIASVFLQLPSCACKPIVLDPLYKDSMNVSTCSSVRVGKTCTMDCAKGLLRTRSPPNQAYTCQESGQFAQLGVNASFLPTGVWGMSIYLIPCDMNGGIG